MEKSGAELMKEPILEVATPSTAAKGESSEWGSGTLGSPFDSDCADSSSPTDASSEVRRISFEEGLEAGIETELAPESSSVPSSRVYWEAFFVNMPMFCGYAALFGLQHEIKSKFAIGDGDVSGSRAFGVACSFLYIFNLIFRFSHNVVFGFMGPRGRAFVAMASMMISMLVIAGPIFILESYHMGWVMLAYALGGVAVGTFEANFLCCLTPLGSHTKHVAITAIPVGITGVLVGGFFAMGPPLNIPAVGIYLAVALAVFFGMVLFALRIPQDQQLKNAQPGLRQFIKEARMWRLWLPLMWSLPFATAIDMFALSAFSPGVALYIWDQKTVTLMPGFVLPTHSFFAIYNTFNMLGGLCGRILSYKVQPRHPIIYALLNVLGAMILLLKIPLLAPMSTFIVMMGDGLIYGSITRRIDAIVPKEFNLIALSFWLFVGDFGSVAGSNLISYIRVWVVGA